MNAITVLLPEFVPELRQGEKTGDRSLSKIIQLLNASFVACLDFLGELLCEACFELPLEQGY